MQKYSKEGAASCTGGIPLFLLPKDNGFINRTSDKRPIGQGD
jgi:hypothetical protein